MQPPPTETGEPDTSAATSPTAVAERERAERQREREARRQRQGQAQSEPQGMVPARERRRTRLERGSMRLVATSGIVGISVLLGAILVGQSVEGWITGLVCGAVSVILAAILWSSRTL